MRVGFITGIGARGHILVRVRGRNYIGGGSVNGFDYDHAWTLCGRSTEQTQTTSVTWETENMADVDCANCRRKAAGSTAIPCEEIAE